MDVSVLKMVIISYLMKDEEQMCCVKAAVRLCPDVTTAGILRGTVKPDMKSA